LRVTANQPDTNSNSSPNPNPNLYYRPTTKHRAAVSVQQTIVTTATKLIRLYLTMNHNQ